MLGLVILAAVAGVFAFLAIILKVMEEVRERRTDLAAPQERFRTTIRGSGRRRPHYRSSVLRH
jgi:hypothetical protein